MNINKENSKAIIVFCSKLEISQTSKPLSNAEFRDLLIELDKKNIELYQLFDFSDEEFKSKIDLPIKRKRKSKVLIDLKRLKSLISRKISIFFKVEKLNNIGLKIVTLSDSGYPKKIHEKLKENAPPLFYYTGDINLLNKSLIGFLGSRNVDDNDIKITKDLVKNFNKTGIVSGGAEGIDSICINESLNNNSFGVEFLAGSMLKRIKKTNTAKAIQDNKLLLISAALPSDRSYKYTAMERNKFIYICSKQAIVIKSDHEKGGTWAGAIANLNKKYTKLYCVDIDYKGNQELIKKGAIPIKIDSNLSKDTINKKDNLNNDSKDAINEKDNLNKTEKLTNIEKAKSSQTSLFNFK
ncbi:MAG: DNA-processing protein DprA [Methanobrevibacter sp.]|jgi:predicted Rossmann fold nucleotide-binding protein DprA/Smf involved in DNA uptake|nr:DNA-processing protein DprA [Methanobrevibacter sp.]